MITYKTLTLCALACISLPALFTGCETHAQGKQIFQREKCVDCHTINGKGGAVGPNLTNVGNRRSREYIIEQLKNPKSHNPDTAMPSFSRLPDQDLKDLVDYLSSLK
jgi:mono/diheme cytochrome c family protein